MHISRRSFLRGVGLTAGAAWLAPDLLRGANAASLAASPGGTTLEATIVPTGTGLYKRLVDGPPQPIVVRALGAEPKVGREDRRVAITSIVHLTDVHVIDAQSPARVEFIDRYGDPVAGAYRPQETLTTQVADAMVQRVNALRRGPITGRPFDCAISTGDNIDNQQENELDWFLTVLDGGRLTPNSGGPAYEGVQDQDALTFDAHYWHPEDPSPTRDFYKRHYGFPAYPGLLAAAVAPFTAHGLKVPWYSVNGNHDGLVQGNAPENTAFEEIATGRVKVVNLPGQMTHLDLQNGLTRQDPTVLAALATAPARIVTEDERRRFVSAKELAAAHLRPGNSPGPRGHGLTQDNVDRSILYYTFEPAPAVTGIVLDTCNRIGYADGSIDGPQFAWLEQELKKVSSRYYDSAGALVRTAAADRVVVIFSHHNLDTMGNQFPDPSTGGKRVLSAEIRSLLHRFPNVVAWVNGHSHENRVIARPDAGGRTAGFWELLTAAHVDYPQQARIVEVADNKDGTISVFGTIIEHAAPAATKVGATDVLGLAAISRELSVNDYQVNLARALGTPQDRNVELVLPAPFDVAGSTSGSHTRVAGSSQANGADSRQATLPATGAPLDVRLGVGAAALGAALALRRRGEPEA